jgi:hypothetical protein
VKARDRELAWTTGSGAVVGAAVLVLVREDPAPVAAPTVVDDAGFAVVDDPGAVVVVVGPDWEPLAGGASVVPVATTVVCVGEGVVVVLDGGSFGGVVGVGEQVPSGGQVDPDVDPVAITGEALAPPGALDTMPVGAALLGYGLHVKLRSLPDITSVNEMAGSTVSVTWPPVGVKGPMVPADDGRSKVRPVAGSGLGMGTLMSMGPDDTVAGVAPTASTFTTASPTIAELPRAAAAPAIDDGSVSWVWKLVASNDCPTDSALGIEAVVVTLLRTMLPTGVPGQYSSYAPVTWPGGIVVGGGDVVGIVTGPAVTITGEMGDASGGMPVMPEGALSSG